MVWLRIDNGAGPNAHQPLDDDAVSGLQALLDDDVGARVFSQDHAARLRFIARTQSQHGLHPLQFFDRALRRQQSVLPFADSHANPAELTRQQNVLRIRKSSLQFECSSFRIDLVVRILDMALARKNRAIRQ